MPERTLSQSTVRKIALATQGLTHPPSHSATHADVLAAIQRMGALQIDTINIVARSPYLSLWSRLGSYDSAWLDQLLAEGAIYEYWGHAASFMPIETYPYFRRFMLEKNLYWHHQKEWYNVHQNEVDPILEYVRQNGAVRSADFERKDGVKGTWWNWKIEKDALEHWFIVGELMIARREKFQRVYDLRERVLPLWDDSLTPDYDTALRALVLKAVDCLGIARLDWVADYFRLPKTRVAQALQQFQEEGLLVPLQVENWADPVLTRAESLDALLETPEASGTTLLPPFDALIWHRARTRKIFNFDFALECYLPAPKRIYGYYLLPILHQGQLVGRLDAKAYRKEKYFEVKALYLEAGVRQDEELAAGIAGALRACAAWHRTPDVVVRSCQPAEFQPLLERALEI